MKSIAVFCGSSSGNAVEIVESAYNMGAYIANHQITLVYGGGKVGLMEQVAKGALENQGNVIGIIPHFLKEKEVHHTGLSELLLVDTMHERKLRMHELSDGVLMLPGGFGTFEEFFEMLTWAQLGLHQKPLGILNINGFYDPLAAMFDKMVANQLLKEENKNMVLVDNTIETVMKKMKNYKGHTTPKWMDRNQT